MIVILNRKSMAENLAWIWRNSWILCTKCSNHTKNLGNTLIGRW